MSSISSADLQSYLRDLSINKMLQHKREDSKAMSPLQLARGVNTPSIGCSDYEEVTVRVDESTILLIAAGPTVNTYLPPSQQKGYFSFQHTLH